MERYTASVSRGKVARHHNDRMAYRYKSTPEHIDQARTADNVTLVSVDPRESYAETFGEALAEYNAAQVAKRHPERQISDYWEHCRDSRQTKTLYEFVVQVGNHEAHPEEADSVAYLRDWLHKAQERMPWFKITSAIIHVDEQAHGTVHMHVEGYPVAESARGLKLQNSLNKALKKAYGKAGFDGWIGEMQEITTELMAERGWERLEGNEPRHHHRTPEQQRRWGEAQRELERAEAETAQAQERSRHAQASARWDNGKAHEAAEARQEAEAAARDVARQAEAAREELLSLNRQCQEAEKATDKARQELDALSSEVSTLEKERAALADEVRQLRESISAIFEKLRHQLERWWLERGPWRRERDTVVIGEVMGQLAQAIDRAEPLRSRVR